MRLLGRADGRNYFFMLLGNRQRYLLWGREYTKMLVCQTKASVSFAYVYSTCIFFVYLHVLTL